MGQKAVTNTSLIEDVVATHIQGLVFTDPLEVDEYLRAKLSTYFLHIGQQQVFEHILAGDVLGVSDGNVALFNGSGLVSPPLAECFDKYLE